MPSRDHDWFVGEMGLTFEADGFTRIGGRLFGHLLLADRPLSLDELADALKVSKASISTDSRRLLEKGVVHRSAKPGDRRDYLQIAPDFFSSIMQHRVERWKKLNALVGELKHRSPSPAPAVRARLRYMEDVYDYISGRVDEALESWQARRLNKPAQKSAPKTPKTRRLAKPRKKSRAA